MEEIPWQRIVGMLEGHTEGDREGEMLQFVSFLFISNFPTNWVGDTTNNEATNIDRGPV